jgi:hypothetical protein
MMSKCFVYLLLLNRAGQVGDMWNTWRGRAGESAVTILRFLCGSPRPCRLRSASFWC